MENFMSEWIDKQMAINNDLIKNVGKLNSKIIELKYQNKVLKETIKELRDESNSKN